MGRDKDKKQDEEKSVDPRIEELIQLVRRQEERITELVAETEKRDKIIEQEKQKNKNLESKASNSSITVQASTSAQANSESHSVENEKSRILLNENPIENHFVGSNLSTELVQELSTMVAKSNSHAKVNSKLPYFYGKPNEDIDLWFYSVEIYFKTNRIAEEDKVIIASNYLRNATLHSLRSLEMSNS